MGRETGRLQYAIVKALRAWGKPPSSLNGMAAVGTHEKSAASPLCRTREWTEDAPPSLISPSIFAPAPEKKCELRRRSLLQIRDPASGLVIEAVRNWSTHNPSADLCGLRATGGWGWVHAFDPIVNTILYTIMIYTNQSTLASRIRETLFDA